MIKTLNDRGFFLLDFQSNLTKVPIKYSYFVNSFNFIGFICILAIASYLLTRIIDNLGATNTAAVISYTPVFAVLQKVFNKNACASTYEGRLAFILVSLPLRFIFFSISKGMLFVFVMGIQFSYLPCLLDSFCIYITILTLNCILIFGQNYLNIWVAYL